VKWGKRETAGRFASVLPGVASPTGAFGGARGLESGSGLPSSWVVRQRFTLQLLERARTGGDG
jgi:hypothetical protein